MKQLLLFLILVTLFSSFAFAEPSFYFKKGTDVDLKIPCVNEGSACSASAVCNITVNDPNSNNIIDNQEMTNSGAFHNYTLINTETIGEYQATVFCIDGTDADYTTFSLATTENGQEQNDWTFILAIAITIGFLLILAVNLGEFDKFTIFLKGILLIFSLIFAMMIPAFFIIKTIKSTFYTTFMGMITVLVLFGLVWLIKWGLSKFEVVV